MNLGVGVDLGSTYCTISWADEYGQPLALLNNDGQSHTPSLVFCEPPQFVMGDVARQSLLLDADRVAAFSKMQLGQNARLRVCDHEYSPEFLATLLLRKMAQDAATSLHEPVENAVLAVPAYFTKKQREVVKDVAQKAGLQPLDVIEDCVAAALYHSASREGMAGTLLVYDLGGSTFHVSILRVEDGIVRIVAAGGDLELGARLWDERLVEHIAAQMREQFGYDPRENRETLADLRLKAEAAKKRLSGKNDTTVVLSIPTKHDGMSLVKKHEHKRIALSREEFAAVTRDLLEETRLICEDVLSQSGTTWEDVEVVAIGGGSWMPSVREMLCTSVQRDILWKEPDICVAHGCALHAARLSLEPAKALVESLAKVA